MTDRRKFIAGVRQALGRDDARVSLRPPSDTALSIDAAEVSKRALAALENASARQEDLVEALARSAASAGWKVARASTPEEAAGCVRSVALEVEAKSVVRSAHDVLDRIGMDAVLAGIGARTETMTLGDDAGEVERAALREAAIHAELGITGVDYAIAETGSVALLARAEVSRLVSLLPPVYVAVVESARALPSLDELFTLRRDEFHRGNLGSYMNIITGPSRSADIEQTLVTGVHGPGEVHMVLLG